MLPFFRKIRYRLARDNQFFKYSRYAIGEIALVVIGILIALQVNNWHKSYQDKITEKRVLENIRSDLLIQLDIIDSQIRFEENTQRKVDSCTEMVNSRIEILQLTNLLDELSGRLTFVSNRVTFDNIGSYGTSQLITNLELLNEIVKYCQILDYTTSVINNNNLYRINSQFGGFVVNNTLGFKISENGKVDQDHMLGPEQLYTLNIQLVGRRNTSANNLEKSIILKGKTIALINLIDEELKKE